MTYRKAAAINTMRASFNAKKLLKIVSGFFTQLVISPGRLITNRSKQGQTEFILLACANYRKPQAVSKPQAISKPEAISKGR